jgi:surface antigen
MRQAMTILGSAALVACAGCTKSGLGGTVAAPGATPNAVIGSEVLSGAGQPPIGVLEAGLIGADIGQSLEESDRPIAWKAEFEALEYARAGRGTRWQNPRSGNSGEITVGPTYTVNLLDCREFTHNVRIGGRLRVAQGTACRRPDGRWNVIR